MNRVQFQELTAENTVHLEGKRVQIYGFLHQLEDESWLISSQALLRSCCINQSLNNNTSIPLSGLTAFNADRQTGAAVLIEGTLLSQDNRWILDMPVIAQNTATAFDSSFLILIGVGICFIYFTKRIFKRISC